MKSWNAAKVHSLTWFTWKKLPEDCNVLHLVPRKYRLSSSTEPCSEHVGWFLSLQEQHWHVYSQRFSLIPKRGTPAEKVHPSPVMQPGHLRILHCPSAKEHVIALAQPARRWNIKTCLSDIGPFQLSSLSCHCIFLIEAADLGIFPHSRNAVWSLWAKINPTKFAQIKS